MSGAESQLFIALHLQLQRHFFFFFFLTLYAQSPCLKVGLISHVMVAAKGWTVDVAIPASL